MVDLTEWKYDSPRIDSSATSHRALEATRRKKAHKTEAATAFPEEENGEVGGNQDADGESSLRSFAKQQIIEGNRKR